MTQQKTKDLEPAYKQVVCNLAKEKEKTKKLLAERSTLRKQRSRDKQRIKILCLSKIKISEKSAVKSAEIKVLKNKLKPKRHYYSWLMIQLGVTLRMFTNCSYRSISMILTLLKEHLQLEDLSVPCANTIQNWTSKMGLYALKNLDKTYLGVDICVMVDECIQIGNSKMLMLVFAPAFRFSSLCTNGEERDNILNFSDVRVAYMGYDTSWTSAKIDKVLSETLKESGLKVAYMVSDEASTLKCAARIANIPHIPDISHVLGTCLSKTYKKNEAYEKLLSLLSLYKCKGTNQALSYLLPPSQRLKARFMNQKSITTWANKMLSEFTTLNDKEKTFFEDLFLHQPILKSLTICLDIAEFVGLCYKKQGLCLESNQVISDYLSNLAVIDKQTEIFICFLKEYIVQYNEKFSLILKNSGLTIEKQALCQLNGTTDVLESMFGGHKGSVSSNQLVGVSTTCLELPLYHMDVAQLTAQIMPSIEGVFVSDISEWKHGQNVSNQAVQRRKFFRNQHNKSNL